MRNILKIFKKACSYILPTSLYRKWKYKYVVMHNTHWYLLVEDSSSAFPQVAKIKDDTWEKLHVSEVYNLSKEYDASFYHSAKYINKINNAAVSDESDIIKTAKGVVWDKFSDKVFCKTIPTDENLCSYESGRIRVYDAKQIYRIKGEVLSLLGVYASLWAHFLIQFLPKLYFAEQYGLLDKEITLLIPKYTDEHIRQCVKMVIERHPKVKVVECESPKMEYICENLYYIPSVTLQINHSTYLTPYDCVIPQCVLDVLKEKLVEPLVNEAKNVKRTWSDKIYLVRKGTYRCVTNIDEVEDYFRVKGFEFVEPHKLSLVEKAALFSKAKIIAGPCGAAGTNIIFSQNAKFLFIFPFSRVVDMYTNYISKIGNIKVLFVIGEDDTLDIQTGYKVHINEMDAAYKQLIGEKE